MTPMLPTSPADASNRSVSTAVVASLMAAFLLGTALARPAAAQDPDSMMAEMQRRAQQLTAPGPRHEALERFVGEWDVEVALVMPGMDQQVSQGHATYEWLIPGRWLAQRLTDRLFGEEHQNFAIIGYDNYARSYIIAGVSSFDTAFNVSRGPVVDPEGEVIVTYGTQDEYTTGELHKPYKVVTRIIDEDHHVVETWDLGIGPEGAKVLEYRYTRRR